ncbi:low molecular weight protein tyrosine phosphatase family protein [Caulobacter sp. ErkDOM-E]|uniref:low molecular weight protein tyrosine phosphatase family protein n=1 Tax=Caulobacter sp. ErkDOM-E TaxID=3402778 RepID=UPI003AF69396
MKRVLFVCGKNRLRSPTAEQVFSAWPGVEPLTGEMVAEADLIFVMEKAHRAKLTRRFRTHLKSARVICLDIPDDYAFMDPELVRILQARVPKFLPAR